MGEVAAQVGQFVNAYSGDLSDESLEGQRIVVGGIVTGDPDGHHEGEGLDGDRHDGGPAGHHRGRRLPAPVRDRPGRSGGTARSCWSRAEWTTAARRSSVLADLVAEWDDAVVKGPEAFARDVAAGDRGARRRGPNGNGAGRTGTAATGNGSGGQSGGASRPMVAVGPADGRRRPGRPGRAGPTAAPALAVPVVSPLRHDSRATAATPPRRRAVRSRGARPDLRRCARDRGDGSGPRPGPGRPGRGSRPDRGRCDADAPVDAGPTAVLHVRFGAHAPSDRVVVAMETFKALLRDHPGATRVVIHVPPHPGAGPSRWNCAAASPTTRSWSPRSVAGSATGSSSCRSSAA